MKNEATKGDPWGVSQAYSGPAPFFLLLLDDLGQAGLRLRRWRWRQGLHPSLALGRGGPLNTRHNAGISVGLLRTAGIRVLAHGCLLPVPRAATPAGARSERAHGRGGTGAQALPGRGPCAQSPCPSRCCGEETRGTGRRQSPRRRLLLHPRSRWCGYRGGWRTGTGGVSGPTGAEGSPGTAALRVIETAPLGHPKLSELGRSSAGQSPRALRGGQPGAPQSDTRVRGWHACPLVTLRSPCRFFRSSQPDRHQLSPAIIASAKRTPGLTSICGWSTAGATWRDPTPSHSSLGGRMGQQYRGSDYQTQKFQAVASGVPEAAGEVVVGSFLFPFH